MDSHSNIEPSDRERLIQKEQAAQRKMDYLRSFSIKLNVIGGAGVLALCILLYFAGDFINSYVSVSWVVLPAILIGAFYTGKYFYLAWCTDDEDY